MHLILHIILLLSVGVLGGMFITIVFDEYILSVSEAEDLLKRVKAREARESANYPPKKEREKSNEE